jgi:hypothetical protein
MKSLKTNILEKLQISRNKKEEPEFGTLLEFICWCCCTESYETSYGRQAVPVKSEKLNDKRIIEILKNNDKLHSDADILDFFNSHKKDELQNFSEYGSDNGYDIKFSVDDVNFDVHRHMHYSFKYFCKFDIKGFRRENYFKQ